MSSGIFAQPCQFLCGATNEENLPNLKGLPEVAFVGRSNVGKSSLINAVTGQNNLARTSNTPGRTRELNFFSADNQIILVDLPGYGYAKASKRDVSGWTRMMRDYLRGRVTLRRVFLLIDGRHGVKPNDAEMMDFLDELAVPYQLVLTKQDKLSRAAQEPMRLSAEAAAAKHGAAIPQALFTSADKGYGIEELREVMTIIADAYR